MADTSSEERKSEMYKQIILTLGLHDDVPGATLAQCLVFLLNSWLLQEQLKPH